MILVHSDIVSVIPKLTQSNSKVNLENNEYI